MANGTATAVCCCSIYSCMETGIYGYKRFCLSPIVRRHMPASAAQVKTTNTFEVRTENPIFRPNIFL